MQIDLSKFTPATDEEKRQQDVMSKSTTFFKDGMRRLFRNPLAVVSLVLLAIIVLTIVFAPIVVPYKYEEFLRVDGKKDKFAQNIKPFSYSKLEYQYILTEWLVKNGYSAEEAQAVKEKSIAELSDKELNLLLGTTDTSKFEWLRSEYVTPSDINAAVDKPISELTENELEVFFKSKDGSKIKKWEKKNDIKLDKSLSISENFVKKGGDKGAVKLLSDFKTQANNNLKEIRAKSVSLTAKFSKYESENFDVFMKKSKISSTDKWKIIFPHIFGTDELCRDYFIRVIYGTRISLVIGLFASIIVLIIGMIYGSISGYVGGKVDLIMMRIVDIIYSLPDMLIIILLSVVLHEVLQFDNNSIFAKLGTNMVSIFIVFGLLYWVSMARLIRGQILSIKENEYILAARSIGAKPGRIIRKHILPNCLSVIIISTALQIPSAIFTESYLSFVGLGVKAPMPSLGSLANDARGAINSYPYKLIFPAIMICLIVLSLNLLGDGLRDAFDPKLKR